MATLCASSSALYPEGRYRRWQSSVTEHLLLSFCCISLSLASVHPSSRTLTISCKGERGDRESVSARHSEMFCLHPQQRFFTHPGLFFLLSYEDLSPVRARWSSSEMGRCVKFDRSAWCRLASASYCAISWSFYSLFLLCHRLCLIERPIRWRP